MIAYKPPRYVLSSLAVSLGGLLNGLDTGCIGPITAMPQFHGAIGKLSPGLLGFTVSLIMLAGGVPSVFAGHIADKFGRLKTIGAGALLFVLGAVIQGAATNLSMFLVGRAIAGLGEGVFLSNITIYICEIAPSNRRGPLASLPQFMATAGVCIGYFLCYGTVNAKNSLSWRGPYIFQGSIGLILAACTLVLPESPRWLMANGKREEAVKAIRDLDISSVEAETDILQGEQRASLSLWKGITLHIHRGYRTRTMLALFVLGMVQLSGIDGVLYYAPVLFAQAGIPGEQASFLASGLSAILMLAISVPAFLFADKWGRRTSAISGGLILSSCMLIIGSLYASSAVHPYGIARWVVVVLVFTFGLTFCATWGIVGKIYASEIQPNNTRAAANCVAQGLSFFTNWLVAIITPIFLAHSAFGAYFLFGFLALGSVAVLMAYMPETRGRSLESIQEAFNHPVSVIPTWVSSRRQRAAGDDSMIRSRRSCESVELRSGPTHVASGMIR